MSRTLDSLQEVGYLLDQGHTMRAECPVEASVVLERSQVGEGIVVRMHFRSTVTRKTIASYGTHYADEQMLLDDFGIDDIDEVWEVFDKEGRKGRK